MVVPVAAPVLLAMGVDPIWLGVLMAVNLQTSFLTPPFGFALFYLRGGGAGRAGHRRDLAQGDALRGAPALAPLSPDPFPAARHLPAFVAALIRAPLARLE